ncbi:MAG: peptidoglycan DD-metalloendopeptidase family protein [Candidatus Brocadiae bacterium]|nr:peptidoglycan DD-metalloendopeptidase family protein [Candidatus Brocadiia bacterium]
MTAFPAALRGTCGVGLVCLVVAFVGCRSAPAESGRRPPLLTAEQKKPARNDYFPYVVREGDTLYGLGRRFGVLWQEIAEDNGIKDATNLKVGGLLVIRRAEGVEPPQLVLPPPPQEGKASRRTVSREALHRGKPSSRFWWPTEGQVVQHYGDRVRGLAEPGIGIAAPAGTEVCAVAAGTVVTCVRTDPASPSAWGNVVAIAQAGNMVSWYAHLDRVFVEKGREVSQGGVIGTVGSSGAAERPVLAFRLFRNERFVDPEDYLP